MSLFSALKNIWEGKSIQDGEKPSLINKYSTPKELAKGEEPDILRGIYDKAAKANVSTGSDLGFVHKNPLTDTFQPPITDAKAFAGFWKITEKFKFGEMITNLLGSAYTKTIETGFNWLVVKPLGIITRVRDEIYDRLKGELSENSVERGAKSDKETAEYLQSIDESIGAGPVEEVEGKHLINIRQNIRKSIESAIGDFNRYPPEMDSDADFIQREERDDQAFSGQIETEKSYEIPEPHESDLRLVATLGGLINAKRAEDGRSEYDANLKIDRRLSTIASRRAMYVMNNEAERPVPLSYMFHPPIKREQITQTVRPTSVIGGKPRFENLSYDERKRVIPGSIAANEDGTYTMKMKEKDDDFAKRIREIHAVRRPFSDQYDDLSITVNLNDVEPEDGNHQWLGTPRWILDKILENPEYKLALLSQKQQLGIGICRSGTKATISFLLSKDPVDESESPLTEALPPVDDMEQWWFEQIPEEDRNEESILYKYFHAPAGSAKSFRSGYSLYHFHLFQKNIESLAADRQIKILSVEPYKETILFKEHDVLLITLEINGEKQTIKLLKGTDFIDMPERASSKKGKGDEKSVGNYLSLSEYFQQISAQPERKHDPDQISIPEAHPEVAPGEAEEEETDEEEGAPLASKVIKFPGRSHSVRSRKAA